GPGSPASGGNAMHNLSSGKWMALCCALALPTFGCAGTPTARGGGWIVSASGAGKATFGFNLDCNYNTQEVRGKISYHDLGAGVAFDGHALFAPGPDGCISASDLLFFGGT